MILFFFFFFFFFCFVETRGLEVDYDQNASHIHIQITYLAEKLISTSLESREMAVFFCTLSFCLWHTDCIWNR